MAVVVMSVFIFSAQENRYVGFGNTVPPQKREDDFLNNAMSSLYSVRRPRTCRVPAAPDIAKGVVQWLDIGSVGGPGHMTFHLIKGLFLPPFFFFFFFFF